MSLPSIQRVLHNAQRANSSTSAASHQTQCPTQVFPTNAAVGPSSSASIVQVQTHHLPLHHFNQIPLSSIGQDEIFQKVCSFLSDENNGIIGIYGMGGVGKTTLIERVHTEFLVTFTFDVIFWIIVSKEKDEARIQRTIMNKLGLPYGQEDTQHEQAIKIHDKLCMMNFALLIDDMWEHLDVVKLGIPDPSQVKKSKIIFTTRSEEVCDQMQPHQKVKVNCLGWDDAWILFKQNAGEKTLDSHPRIRDLAIKVAEECGRLPLALKVIGRAMASKRTPQQWENALTTLRKSPSEILGTEEKLFSRLKLSYDALTNPTIKECFLYCCLFPEDWSISKEDLVDYWVGEGFLGINENLMEARKRGVDYLSTLQAAFLLVDDGEGEATVKMHDVIRDMAIWIVSEHGKETSKFFVHPCLGLSKSQIADRWREAHRVFVWDLKEMPQITNKCRILTLIWRSLGAIKSLDALFSSMPLLRVMDLSHSLADELPAAIGKLVELRYLCIKGLDRSPSWLGNLTKLEILNLSNSNIEELPNMIGQLVELRHLNLANCTHLIALPAELGNCCKLEVLNLRGTHPLQKLPTTIGKLAELRYLNLRGTSIKMLPEEFWELKNIEDLYFFGFSRTRITAVELCKLADLQYLNHLGAFVNELSSLKRLSNCLTSLWTDYCPGTRSVELLPLFGNMYKLSKLRILESPVEKIKAGAMSNINALNTSFYSLEKLRVSQCIYLSAIVLDGLSLVNLRKLSIHHCDRLKYITGLQHLQRLEKLSFIGGEMKEVISINEEVTGGSICFPRLKVLDIMCLYELKSICSDNVLFPALETFYLEECSRLLKLPLGLMDGNRRLNQYSGIVGSQEWWNGLKWQDDNFKSFLLPYFKTTLLGQYDVVRLRN